MPALYECLVAHVRTAPLRHALRHRTYLWLIDLDRLPRLPRRRCARWPGSTPRDHFAGTAPTLRAGLDALPRRAAASTSTAAGC